MNERPGLREVLAVWALFALVAAEIFATYSRLPARDLYHVSGSGPGAGAGRVLVFLNFPVALVAIPAAVLAAERLGTRAAAAAALAAVLLCAAVFWPGVVDQGDLDARPVNAIPAVGVAIAVALTLAAARGGGRRLAGDRFRLMLSGPVLLVGLEWLVADLGFFASDVPVLGRLFAAEEPWAPFGQARLVPIVHPGHHHGMDGVLLVLSAFALSRPLVEMRRPRLRVVVGAYLALMLAYGLANELNDAWLEQLHKRGWVSWTVPSVLLPAPTFAWLGILLVAALVTPLLLADRSQPARGRRWSAAAAVGAAALVALVVVGTTVRGSVPTTPRASGIEGELAFPLADHGFDIYLIRTDGSGLRSVADGDSSEVAPAWSPDGHALVFQSNRDGKTAVYRESGELLADGGEPSLGRNGLAVVREGEIWIGSRRLADGEWPHVSPDGRTVAFDRDGDIWSDGRRLTRGPADDRFPAWSPDGKKVVFESDRAGSYDLWIVDAIGGEPEQLTSGPAGDFGPSWSPDGRFVAFVSDRDGRDQIYIVEVATGEVGRVTDSEDDKDAPAWRPSR